MKLADLIARETGVGTESVMLLRHSGSTIKRLLKRGGTVEDYTVVQPINSKYDYHDPRKTRIDVVVVVVDNKVHGIYRVTGVEKEGTSYSLESDAMRQMNIDRQRPEVPARRFGIVQLPSAATGKKNSGWENRQRTAVQRIDGSFFDEIEVDVPNSLPSDEDFRKQFDKAVKRSIQDSSEARQRRLAVAPKIPARIEVRSIVFIRNSDVVVEVLARAKGRCELCKQSAPFTRRSNGSPYLEVHHKIRLASDGEDTVENAYALCPNCHRREHYA